MHLQQSLDERYGELPEPVGGEKNRGEFTEPPFLQTKADQSI